MARTSRHTHKKTAPPINRRLFDDVIDCLYEYDLGEDLPSHWPLRVQRAIYAARERIINRGRVSMRHRHR
jgi:hypothetical protein